MKLLYFKSPSCNEFIIHPKLEVCWALILDPHYEFSFFVQLDGSVLWIRRTKSSYRELFCFVLKSGLAKKMPKRAKSQQTTSGLLSQCQSFTDIKKAKNEVHTNLLS